MFMVSFSVGQPEPFKVQTVAALPKRGVGLASFFFRLVRKIFRLAGGKKK